MSTWSSSKWNGQYWGQKKAKGRNSQGKGAARTSQAPAPKQKDQGLFPSYDTMEVDGSGGPSSSSQPSSDSMWQMALRSLIQSNPNLAIPREVTEALAGNAAKEAKTELYTQQKQLNQRRKAVQRVERLEGALKRKKLQMVAYQEHLKRQLQQELQRFRQEQEGIESQLKDAKEYLEKLDRGEDVEEMDHFIDTNENSLAEMLGVTASTDDPVQLQKERKATKEEAYAMVHQLQTQMQWIMQHGAAQSGLSDPLNGVMSGIGNGAYGPSPKRASPQAPVNVGPFRRARAQDRDNREKEEPSLAEVLQMNTMEWSVQVWADLTELSRLWRIVVCVLSCTVGTSAQVHQKDSTVRWWIRVVLVQRLQLQRWSYSPYVIDVRQRWGAAPQISTTSTKDGGAMRTIRYLVLAGTSTGQIGMWTTGWHLDVYIDLVFCYIFSWSSAT